MKRKEEEEEEEEKKIGGILILGDMLHLYLRRIVITVYLVMGYFTICLSPYIQGFTQNYDYGLIISYS